MRNLPEVERSGEPRDENCSWICQVLGAAIVAVVLVAVVMFIHPVTP